MCCVCEESQGRLACNIRNAELRFFTKEYIKEELCLAGVPGNQNKYCFYTLNMSLIITIIIIIIINNNNNSNNNNNNTLNTFSTAPVVGLRLHNSGKQSELNLKRLMHKHFFKIKSKRNINIFYSSSSLTTALFCVYHITNERTFQPIVCNLPPMASPKFILKQ